MKKTVLLLTLLFAAVLVGSCTSTDINEELQNVQDNELEIQLIKPGKVVPPGGRGK